MNDIREQIKLRLYFVMVLLFILPVIIWGKMSWIAVLDSGELTRKVEQQSDRKFIEPAIRGEILDRNGRVLVATTATYSLALDPTADGFNSQKRRFIEKLSQLMNVPAERYRRMIDNRSSRQYILLHRVITPAQYDQLIQWQVPGIRLHSDYGRRYNYGTLASHILGHVNTDQNGIAGIEKQADSLLQGENGWKQARMIPLVGLQPVVGGNAIPPKHGETLTLTIDLVRQAIAEEELARGLEESGAKWGSVIAMNPKTGAILAIANLPVYDSNTPGRFTNDSRRNRAITDRIEPGSTFKVVTAVAAIEQAVTTPADSLKTGQGWHMFHGVQMNDTKAMGTISFADAISRSSNIGVALTATKVPDGEFYQYARNMGFGQQTGIDLFGEVAGNLKRPSTWSRITKPWMSIGYEIEVTPLQMLQAYATLANKGALMQPYVIESRQDILGNELYRTEPIKIRQAFSEETAEQIFPLFERVVTDGTGTAAAVKGLRIAGKTGTAQKVVNGAYTQTYRASFAGFFPVDDPEVALIVVLDEPQTSGYGGVVAAPIFRRIVERWIGTFPNIASKLDDADPLLSPDSSLVPKVTSLSTTSAAIALFGMGFDVEFDGCDTDNADRTSLIIQSQNPSAGRRIPNNETVTLTCQEEANNLKMPNLVGLGLRQALALLDDLEIVPKIEGHGLIQRQSLAGGTIITDQNKSQITLFCQ